MLASHWIVDGIHARLIGHLLDDGLQTILELLSVQTSLRGGGCLLIVLIATAKAQPLKLIGSGGDVDELLLKLLLALHEPLVGGHELIVKLRVNLIGVGIA